MASARAGSGFACARLVVAGTAEVAGGGPSDAVLIEAGLTKTVFTKIGCSGSLEPGAARGGIGIAAVVAGSALAGGMMAAPITVTGSTLEPGAPVVLFPTRIVGGGVEAFQGRQYDVAPDGRFLINTVLDEAPAPITLLMNWHPETKK